MPLPGPLRIIGKKHIEQAAQWAVSGAAFGAAGAYGVCYFTDWKAVLQYVPYYNGKWADQ